MCKVHNNVPGWIEHVQPVTLTARYCLYTTLLTIYVDVTQKLSPKPERNEGIHK